jgi:hypothetical protein
MRRIQPARLKGFAVHRHQRSSFIHIGDRDGGGEVFAQVGLQAEE